MSLTFGQLDLEIDAAIAESNTSLVASSGFYEASRDPAEPLKVRGIGRLGDEPRALLVMLSERPTDDEIKHLHEFLRRWQYWL